MPFYSARLIYYILIDDGRRRRRHHCEETVVVFRAQDYDHAFARALELGHAAETEYLNGAGQTVRWAFAAVETIDHVGSRLDGAEVASRQHVRVSPKPLSASVRFHPERSRPESSAPAGLLQRPAKASRDRRGAA